MYVHAFGAYFGIAASYHFERRRAQEDIDGESRGEGGYVSQTIAMVGTLFLWMFWPSFNSALAAGSQ